jgi:hypothetical protein
LSGKPGLRLTVVKIGYMNQLFSLVFDRLHHFRVAMAYTVYGNPCQGIDIFIAFGIPNFCTKPPGKSDRVPLVDFKMVLFRKFAYVVT